jgi:biopolymer transport protein ExbB
MRTWFIGLLMAGLVFGAGYGAFPAVAQDEPAADAAPVAEAAPAEAAPAEAAPAEAAPAAEGAAMELDKKVAEGAKQEQKGISFMDIVLSSGIFGVLDWVGLLICMLLGIYFTVDCFILIRSNRVMPPGLIKNVTDAMAQGDVFKALASCKNEPGPMSNILTAGFSHVEEGFDVIQEAIGIAADFESELLTQRIQYLTLVAALSPMLGLLGTVQGMIYAFFNLAIMGSGAAQTGVLALNIGQALYTTAAGLCITIPVMSCYHILRNRSNKIILRMQALTMDLIKDLRNVEVVTE